MGTYSLETDEVVLYQGAARKDNLSGNIILTNKNIVFTSKKLQLFKKSEEFLEISSVEDIKIYNGEPQIKTNGVHVETFFLNETVVFTFPSRIETIKYVNAIKKHLLGKSIAERGSSKMKDAINLVNDTLGIDTIGTVKNVIENGVLGSALGSFGKKFNSKSKSNTLPNKIFSTANTLLNKVDEEKSESNDEIVSKINQLKYLLDSGAITQEEFDNKKLELLSRL